MKIGYFTSAFPYRNPLTGKITKPYRFGGVENVVYNLAVQMEKRGHEIFIFTSSTGSKNSIEDYGKIKIYRYKNNFNIGPAPISVGLIYKPLLYKLDLDIIHTHLGSLPAPLTAVLYSTIISKKPFIVTHHGDWIGGYGGISRKFGVFLFNNSICDIILSKADKIIGLSNGHINDSQFLQKYIKKVCLIPNGVNSDEFEIKFSKKECREKLGLPINKKIILFVGSLAPRKCPQILLKSMIKIIEYIPDSYLVFVGDGIIKDLLMEESERLGFENKVKFSGFIGEDQKVLYYNAADIFVLPSLSEALPLVLLEASASGLPLVVSDLEVFRSIVKEGFNGLFTKTGDEDDLANKIIYLLENDNLRAKMGSYAKNDSTRFSWAQVAEETENLYLSFSR